MSKVVKIGRAESPEEVAFKQSVVDQYGEITRRLALTEPDEAEARLLKEQIESWYIHSPGDITAIARGRIYEVQISARRSERTITDKPKAFAALKKSLGLNGLIAVIEIGMATLDRSVPKSMQKAFVTEERSGYRTMKVVALHPTMPELDKAA